MKTAVVSVMLHVFAIALVSTTAAQTESASPLSPGGSPELCTPAKITWKAGPPSLPAGAKFAVLEGDPAKEGFFTMRILLPDGYRIPPHTHPKVEHVTVISGTFHLGMGATFKQAGAQPMPAGTFGYWPAGMQHFAWSEGETVVQLHGIGPWQIVYINPADDPRNATTSTKP